MEEMQTTQQSQAPEPEVKEVAATIKTPQRIGWLDAAKGIGLLCVIIGHFRLSALSSWIYTFHIPLFFFLSGFVFSGKKYNFKEYMLKKVKTLLIPYFMLGLGIFAVWCLIYLAQGQPFDMYVQMLWDFIKQEHFWTIWFLACLFIVEIAYYWIDKAAAKWKWLSTVISALLCVLGFVWYRLGGKGLPWNLDIALVAQFFFHVGYLFKQAGKIRAFLFEGKLWKKLLLIGCSFVINVGAGVACIKLTGQSLDMSVGSYGNELLTLISAFAGIVTVCMVANVFPWKGFTYLGQNTMLIFAWHSRIVMVLMDLCYVAIGWQLDSSLAVSLAQSAITFVVIFIVLVPLTEMIKRSRLKWMLGKWEKKNG